MSSVLLIDAPWQWRSGTPELGHPIPLGLASLAGALTARGHDAAVHTPGLDPWDGHDTGRALDAAVAEHRPDLIGVACTSASWAAARRVVSELRRLAPAAAIVLGGVHPTLRPDEVADTEGVDLVVRGEAEETLPAIVDRFAAAGGRPSDAALRGFRGLTWRSGDGAIHHTQDAPAPEDLDSIPDPDYERVLWRERAASSMFSGLLASRGCPYACTYCASEALTARRVRRRSPERVATEAARLVERFGVDYLFYHDSVFTLSASYTAALLDAVQARVGALPFSCQTRVEHVDPVVAETLARGGCARVLLGFESGVPETLARIGKSDDLDRARRATRSLVAAGVRVSGFFIVGFPWETSDDMRRTLDFAESLDLEAIHLFSATPLPGTALALETGLDTFPEGHDFRAPTLNLTGLPDEAYRTLFAKLARRAVTYNGARAMREASRLAEALSAQREDPRR